MAFADSTNVKETSYQLRAYFVPWEELRRKQGALTASQLQAVNSGITSGFVALIAQNAADINTLRGLVTAQIRLRKVTALPDEGEANVLYLVPDAGADPTSPDQCTEYIWDDDRYEIVGKTSVTPGNGKLTINVNGQAAGSFSADQSTDTTIGITVPLAVSDLQNDSGFQTASDVAAAVAALSAQLAAVAFSGSYDDLTDKPSYPGIGDGTLTIAQNGAQVGSFSANQDAASTINIVTPTKTSDLQNDSGFVDTSDLDTKQDELSEAQLAAVNSGITDTAVAQIEVNRVAIQGKQAQLTQTQLNAVNSGITSGKVALFDAHLADTDAHVTAAQKAAWTAKQDALTGAQMAAVDSGVTAQKVTEYDDHVADADIHVTAAQKAAWTAKQDALNANQLNAVNSGITSALVTQIGTNQTDIAAKANDSDVVHRSGAETIPGLKTFTANTIAIQNGTNSTLAYKLQFDSYTLGTPPASNLTGTFRMYDSSNNILFDLMGQAQANGINAIILRVRNTDGTSNFDRRINFSVNTGGFTYFAPSTTNTIDLGASTNKWKTLNGVNPGALGMPDVSSAISIDTTDWRTAYNQPNDLKINNANPSYPGWLFIKLDNCTAENDFLIVRYVGTGHANPTFYGSFIQTASSFVLTTPIPAGVTIKVWVSKLPSYCKYYPCLGNV